ncbi:MAG: PIG-L family deacetylase, partial [Chloroflexi bacterium]|nr:PIG-L family deacetylase [Chloroflexota bacterium]
MTEEEKFSRGMVVVAHADDAEFGCSGTVAKLCAEGWEMVYVMCTDGSKGSSDREITEKELAATRREEQINAGKVLGLKDVVFLDYPDSYLEPTLELRKDIISGSDETKRTCENSVVLIAGETELLACQFTADDPVEPSFRHYFMRVYWNDELIYDPTDPDIREAVTIEHASQTPTPTPSPTVTETLIVPFKKQSGEPAGSTTASTYEKLVRLTNSGTG